MLTNAAGNLANAARRDDVESLDLVTDASEDPSLVGIWRGCVNTSRLDLPNNRALGLAYQQEAGKLNQAAARRVPGSPHADTSVPESGVAATIVTSLLPAVVRSREDLEAPRLQTDLDQSTAQIEPCSMDSVKIEKALLLMLR